MDNKTIETLAARIVDLFPMWERDDDAMEQTIDCLKNSPEVIISNLLDRIDDLS